MAVSGGGVSASVHAGIHTPPGPGPGHPPWALAWTPPLGLGLDTTPQAWTHPHPRALAWTPPLGLGLDTTPRQARTHPPLPGLGLDTPLGLGLDTPSVDRLLNTHLRKHYLSATLFADGNKPQGMIIEQIRNSQPGLGRDHFTAIVSLKFSAKLIQFSWIDE